VIALLRMEVGKLGRLASVRFALVVLAVFPWLWAYAPGVFDVYGFFIVSGFQVPALSLLSSMSFLLPLLVAIAAAELLGLEIQHGTLPTVLLRPVTRSQWLLAKLLVASAIPFLGLGWFLLASLLAGASFGFGPSSAAPGSVARACSASGCWRRRRRGASCCRRTWSPPTRWCPSRCWRCCSRCCS